MSLLSLMSLVPASRRACPGPWAGIDHGRGRIGPPPGLERPG